MIYIVKVVWISVIVDKAHLEPVYPSNNRIEIFLYCIIHRPKVEQHGFRMNEGSGPVNYRVGACIDRKHVDAHDNIVVHIEVDAIG